MACIPDTITPKGVLINLNSGSDYTNCTVYTGLTDSVITGATNCVNVTGTTCSLTGISATLLEIYVRIDCEGCCSNTFRVNLDECCGYEEVLTPTPTYSQTITPTPTYSQTITPTPTPSVCQCNTYRITFNNNCGEAINWTACDTEVSMSEQGNYFGLSNLTFISGTVLDLCSCTLPTTTCGATISLISSGCTLEGGFTITTPTPTPTVTVDVSCTCYELYTTPNLNPTSAFLGNSTFTYRSCGTNEIEMIQISDEGFGNPSGTRICARTGSVEQTSGDSGYSIESEINCCESVEPTPTLTITPTQNVLGASSSASMEPCIGGTIDDYMGASVYLTAPVTIETNFDVTVYYKYLGNNCNYPNITTGANTTTFMVTILAGESNGNVNACTQGQYFPSGANICGACITNSDNTVDIITFTNPVGC